MTNGTCSQPNNCNVFHSVDVATIICALLLLLATVLFLTLRCVLLPKRRRQSTEEQKLLLHHAVITGGSSGIGLSIAEECIASNCAFVTILARNETRLKEARTNLQKFAATCHSSTTIDSVAVDVSDADAMSSAARNISNSTAGPPTLLFNVAGTSSSSSFLDTDYMEFERLMKINYLGTVFCTRAFMPFLTSTAPSDSKPPRTIVLTSSQAAQVGVYGYSAYGPTKAALRALAETLQMEFGATENIHVQLAFPSDTDTPGYKLEQVGKPTETQLISENSGLWSPNQVAKIMVKSATSPIRPPPFVVYFGLEGWLLSTLNAGMSPVHSVLHAMTQILVMGLLRFVSLFYLMNFQTIINGHRSKKEKNDVTDEEKKVNE